MELYFDTVFSHLETTNQLFKQNGIQKNMRRINLNHGKIDYSELAFYYTSALLTNNRVLC